MSMDDRPVMIGQAPSRIGDPRTPCAGGCFQRLADAAGAGTHRERLRFYAAFVRLNVFTRYRGRDGKGDRFPMAEAKDRADGMRVWLDGRTVVLVGKSVACAFRMSDPEYLRWTVDPPAPGARAVVVPHPSGVNRWWNDPENRERAARFLGELFEAARARRAKV